MNCDENPNRYLKPQDVSKLLNLTPTTLINWENEGRITCIRTKGGHRRYLLSSIVERFPDLKPAPIRRKICYGRVSTASQKDDLSRQLDFFRSHYRDYECLSDIGSGINFKRKNFKAILDCAIKGNLEELVVTHRDRLCRFGFELIEGIVEGQSNGKIVVLDKEETSPEVELTRDLLAIITVFSSRLYGLRSHKIKKAISNAQNESLSDGERKSSAITGDGTVSVVL
jgi:putative resolvase